MTNMNPIARRIEQFDLAHTFDGPAVDDGGMVYFPDGAKREVNPHGALWDVPRRDEDRLRHIKHYWTVVEKRCIRAFHATKSRIINNPATHPNHKQNVAELRELQATARAATAALREAKAAYDEVCPMRPATAPCPHKHPPAHAVGHLQEIDEIHI